MCLVRIARSLQKPPRAGVAPDDQPELRPTPAGSEGVRKMRVIPLLFIALGRSVLFVGRTWWTLMLGWRLAVLLLVGFTLFSDEQERFVCNTIQPGCSNVCFDAFAPVSVFHLWLFHLLLLALPHLLFATYVMHEVSTPPPGSGGSDCGRSRGDSPSSRENSGWSREPSLQEPGGPRFSCAYMLLVVVRILLEAAFGAGQLRLFGLSFPKSFLCYEAPCTSGVECFISRRTEKSLMLSFMLAVGSLSILLSLFELLSSGKAMVRWRRRRRGRRGETLVEEMIKGEQSSMIRATAAEDGNKSPESSPHSKDAQADTPPTPTSTAAPSRLGPPLSPRPGREPPSTLRAPAPVGTRDTDQYDPVRTSSDCQDRRAWV